MKIASLDYVKKQYPLIGEALESINNVLDTAQQKLSVNFQGATGVPAPHSAINVTAANGIVHVSVANGNNPRTRNLSNFVEYSSDPAFGENSDVQVEHLGVGTQRRIATFVGATPLYFRSYCQYPDGTRSKVIYHGTQTAPTAVLDGTPTFINSATGTGITTTTGTLQGPALPKGLGSGTSNVPGYGFGKESFVPNPSLPAKPPKVFE